VPAISDLHDVLLQVAARIAKTAGFAVNEQDTKASLIDPVLRALGWDVEDWMEVKREFRAGPGDNPVDYALLDSATGKALALVEAKALAGYLADNKWAGQIMGYAHVVGVHWVALTNGDHYRIYNAYGEGPVAEKLFREFSVKESLAQAESGLGFLRKESLAGGETEDAWKLFALNQQLTLALHGLLDPAPDPKLVNLISQRAPGAAPKDIQDWLRGIRFSRGSHPVQPLQTREAETVPPPVHTPSAPGPGARHVHAVNLGQLIAAGLLRPPLELEATFHGRRLTATVQDDGLVEFSGSRYTSLSTAGAEAKRTVIGRPLATNGWDFWLCRDVNGHLGPISILRSRFPPS